MAPLIFILLLILLSFLPGADSVRTVSSLTVQRGGSVTIPCHYDEEYEHHVKYWCKGSPWIFCTIVVRTDSPQRKGGVSITDDPAQQVFTVTLSDLQVTDSDTYWCAVEKGGYGTLDDKVSISLSVTAGTPALSVEKNRVSGVEGGNVSILCHYGNSLQETQKMWCSIGDGVSCVTAGSSEESQSRVRLNDDETQGLLTVTVRELERSDTGWYWCAAGDLQIPVHIYVTEKSPASSDSTTTTTKRNGNSPTTNTITALLATFGLLLLLVTIAMVSCKLWNTQKKTQNERRAGNRNTRFTEPDYETAYITVMPPADSGDEVTYSSIVLQHRETGQQAPPSCVDAADAVTYSSVAPQRKHSH
ncbi:hypothetical protein AGOR_G00032850 [Albula goreensis]|uniref:Ig-like domain-containing protein n=1 Tax=Albula goreensis TaxID=1534307 RepID=A0A8T3DZD0_9TELE|nr:hypothetical protein AGOR_G00032850 [Albula goreensis]